MESIRSSQYSTFIPLCSNKVPGKRIPSFTEYLDDNESLVSNLTVRRSMNNVPRTYVQTSLSRRLRYTFVLNRLKSLELEAFFDAYNGASIKMLNWKGEIWQIKLITNPVDFVQTRRAEPGGDRTDVNLEFEGVLING